MCIYVSEICAEKIFVTFPWWLKNVKSRSKIALFSNERHFEIWFPKKRTIMFFWSKLSKLHKKDPSLHVATTFSLKQGETRTSLGPIPHPLISSTIYWMKNGWRKVCEALQQNREQVTVWVILVFGIIVRSTHSALIYYQNQVLTHNFWDMTIYVWDLERFLWKCDFKKLAF